MARQFNAQAYNWLPDGTDHSTEMLAILADVYSAGGGEIFFPPSSGVYRADSQVFIPNNGVSPQPKQPTITLLGAGSGPHYWDPNTSRQPPLGASILDLRYQANDGNAKIETRGLGTFAIERLTLIDGGSSNATPFLHTTNTTIFPENCSFVGSGNSGQDAIVLGGPSDKTLGGIVGSPFQGYGTVINRNAFVALNRGVYARTYANGVVITNNTWPYNSTGTRAIEFDGATSGAGVYGAVITGNIFEMQQTYVYGIYGSFFARSYIAGNGFYDDNMANVLFDIYWGDSNCRSNVIVHGYHEHQALALGGDASSISFTTRIGAFTQPTQLSAGNAMAASLNIPKTNAAPTTPIDGDIWYDGTNLKFNQNGTIKTFTWS